MRLVMGGMFAKLLGSVGLLVLYPLAPFLEETWGLTAERMNLLNVLSEIAALPAGFFAPLGDHYDNYYLLIGSWVLTTLSVALLLCPPIFGVLLSVRFLFNFAYTLVQTSLQSVMIHMVSNEERGWVTGLLELSFALAVIGCAGLVVLYNYLNWRWTFGILALVMALLTIELAMKFPHCKPSAVDDVPLRATHSQAQVSASAVAETQPQTHSATELRHRGPRNPVCTDIEMPKKNPLSYMRKCFTRGAVMFCLSAVFINVAHNAIFTVVFYWARDVYNYSASDMAFILLAVGFGELVGSILVTWLADKGIYLGIYIATVVFCLGIVGLIFTENVSIVAGIACIFIMYIGGEFAFVVSIAEVEAYMPPQYRTTLIGLHFQAQFVGRAIGAQLADELYAPFGIRSVCYACLVALVIHTCCIRYAELVKPRRSE